MRQQLIIDADDTLWENNIYFEQAFDEFVDFLAHSTLTAHQVRDVLDEIELVNARVHGYGSVNFGRNLAQCYRHLCERDIAPGDAETVMGFARRILEQPLEIMPGVPETLQYLAARHELTLFTKGHPDEQQMKIDRSGLDHYFTNAVIAKEKDTAAYRDLIARHNIVPERGWMIGNSPKSDINPALEAGLNAVYVPHRTTWTLECEEIRPANGQRFHTISRFDELMRLF